MVTRPEEFRWSSYKSYIGRDMTGAWLKPKPILDYFGEKEKEAKKKYRSFVEDQLGKEYGSPFQNTFGAAVLGTAEFRELVRSNHLADKEVDRAVPGIRQFKISPEPEEILKVVGELMGDKEKLARQVAMYFSHKYSGKKLRDIGKLFGVGETAIAEARRLFPRRMETDAQLREEVERVKEILGI